MDASKEIEIRPLSDEFLPDVLGMHQEGLGYTLNSCLGKDHLAFLYRQMTRDTQSYVAVATLRGTAVGVVSGTLNEDKLKGRLLGAMTVSRLTRIGFRLLMQPRLILLWLQSAIVSMPLRHQGEVIVPVLTALAVRTNSQGHGVGRQLVAGMESFLRANRVRKYRLDTLSTNDRALRFYKGLGFVEVARRAGSVLLVQTLDQQT